MNGIQSIANDPVQFSLISAEELKALLFLTIHGSARIKGAGAGPASDEAKPSPRGEHWPTTEISDMKLFA